MERRDFSEEATTSTSRPFSKKCSSSADFVFKRSPNDIPGISCEKQFEVDKSRRSSNICLAHFDYTPGGIFSCLKRVSPEKWMLFWICWYCTVQGMVVSGLVPSVLSTLERRFNFRSSSLGRIMQWYDIAYAFCCIPVSYFGGRHSKPLFLGFGLLCMSIGSLLFSLPHIIAEQPYSYSERKVEIGFCNVSNYAYRLRPELDEDNYTTHNQNMATAFFIDRRLYDISSFDTNWMNRSNNYRYELMFGLAHLLHGIGSTPLFTLGVSYIDENVKPVMSSFYIAIFYTCVIIGPAAGFFLSSAFLRVHSDFLFAQHDGITHSEVDETDPEWVGAWWVGFQIASMLSLVAVIPILSFPRTLKNALNWQQHRLQERRCQSDAPCFPETSKDISVEISCLKKTDGNVASTVLQHHDSVTVIEEAEQVEPSSIMRRITDDVKHIPAACWKLITNPCYMCITLAASIAGLLISGFSGFMAKYLERQFNVGSSKANLIIGCIMVPFAGAGTLFSGYVVKQFRLTRDKTLKYCILMELSGLILSPMFFVYCEPTKFMNIQASYPTLFNNRQARCAVALSTDSVLMDVGFGQACNDHCSCSVTEYHPVCGRVQNAMSVYSNCTCVDDGAVSVGWCESSCSSLSIFLFLFAPMCFVTFSVGVPALSVVLRSVDYDDRSFALGIQWILIRCIGTIPAPAIFGWMFDISCLTRYTTGEDDGRCIIYNSKLLADLFLAFAAFGQFTALTFLILALYFNRTHCQDRADVISVQTPPECANSGGQCSEAQLVPTYISFIHSAYINSADDVDIAADLVFCML
ncbi:Solute carrier organic anion transporter family member 4A1 [Trichinella pseudospiralis]|uniref:Solute carrier organic anion transporter family member 4A1 n=2 Tax=Trichinella pseudospiralis TaxID=6337 RepID=A0A0V1FV05_TRIPS|nr:Solute carrier organic anion transporter family member 4A1 [Trichinella pseudospiralis]KRZ21342.1 Solute carrier organic anion transporter family member 4A1 [Trichinella pseudospiralis]